MPLTQENCLCLCVCYDNHFLDIANIGENNIIKWILTKKVNIIYRCWLINTVCSTLWCLGQLESVSWIFIKLLNISVKSPPFPVILAVLFNKKECTLLGTDTETELQDSLLQAQIQTHMSEVENSNQGSLLVKWH